MMFFFFQAEDGIRDYKVTGVQTCALPICRTITLNIKDNPHLDYGYAVTSHSSQGQTADRVLVHVDTEQAGERLVNRRLAYVAVSRGRYDAQVYTNDKGQLAEQLARDVSHRSAIEANRESVSFAH